MKIVNKNIFELFQDLQDSIIKYNPYFNKTLIDNAFSFLQKNQTDIEKIKHQLKTAINLTLLEVDDTTIVSTLIFSIDKNIIKNNTKIFSNEIINIVLALQNIWEISYKIWLNKEEIDKLKYDIISSWDDIRIFFIKIVDRYTLLQNLWAYTKEKRFFIANETLDLYLPVVNFFSIWAFLWDMQDLCFKYTYEEEYLKLEKYFWKNYQKNSKKIISINNKIEDEFKKHWLEIINIEWRVKKLHSIYKKLQNKNINITDIYDILWLRVITKTKDEAYIVLWIIHNIFNIKTSRFKDYISVPKSNGYQAIHTTVTDDKWDYIEFQILTQEMAILNKSWVAAHFLYKWFWIDYSNMPEWMNKFLNIQKQTLNSKELLEKIKNSLLNTDIQVYSIDWKPLVLPKNATLIDFAFSQDYESWLHFNWAHINWKIQNNPFYLLSNWDYIKLIKDKKVFLNYKMDNFLKVKTKIARDWLKEVFNEFSKDKLLDVWEYLINHELEKYNLPNFDDIDKEKRQLIIKKFWVLNQNQLFMFIWMWSISLEKFINTTLWLIKIKPQTLTYNLRIYQKSIESTNLSLIIKLLDELQVSILKLWYKKNKTFINLVIKAKKSNIENIVSELNRIPNVLNSVMVLPIRILLFYLLFLVNWFILSSIYFALTLLQMKYTQMHSTEFILFSGWVFMFLSVYFLKIIVERYLPDIVNYKRFWASLALINTFIFWIIFTQFIKLKLNIFTILYLVCIWFFYTKLFFDYKKFKQSKEK